jgi:hypothetical protein
LGHQYLGVLLSGDVEIPAENDHSMQELPRKSVIASSVTAAAREFSAASSMFWIGCSITIHGIGLLSV